MIVSILGYAKSGKTSFAEALLRAARRRGYTAAAIKAGRSLHGGRSAGHAVAARSSQYASRGEGAPDSRRLAAAGADPVVLWTEEGARREGVEEALTREPLPDRQQFREEWERLLPVGVAEALRSRDLLLLEGRLLPGAVVVQMRQQGSGAVKYRRIEGEILIPGENGFDAAVGEIFSRLEERKNAR
jgi:hypothetical protein